MKKHLTLLCCATILSGTILMSEKVEACGEIRGWFCDKLGWFCPSNDAAAMSDETSQMPAEVIVIEEVDSPDESATPSETMQSPEDVIVIEEVDSPDESVAPSETMPDSDDVIVVEELQAPEDITSAPVLEISETTDEDEAGS